MQKKDFLKIFILVAAISVILITGYSGYSGYSFYKPKVNEQTVEFNEYGELIERGIEKPNTESSISQIMQNLNIDESQKLDNMDMKEIRGTLWWEFSPWYYIIKMLLETIHVNPFPGLDPVHPDEPILY